MGCWTIAAYVVTVLILACMLAAFSLAVNWERRYATCFGKDNVASGKIGTSFQMCTCDDPTQDKYNTIRITNVTNWCLLNHRATVYDSMQQMRTADKWVAGMTGTSSALLIVICLMSWFGHNSANIQRAKIGLFAVIAVAVSIALTLMGVLMRHLTDTGDVGDSAADSTGMKKMWLLAECGNHFTSNIEFDQLHAAFWLIVASLIILALGIIVFNVVNVLVSYKTRKGDVIDSDGRPVLDKNPLYLHIHANIGHKEVAKFVQPALDDRQREENEREVEMTVLKDGHDATVLHAASRVNAAVGVNYGHNFIRYAGASSRASLAGNWPGAGRR